MPTATTMKRFEQQHISIEVPLDHFAMQFGYEDRDSIQIRLEKNGTIYVCDDRETRKYDEPRMISGHVSWELFAKKWPGFARYLLAKEHEAAQAAEGE